METYRMRLDPREALPPIPAFDKVFTHITSLGYKPEVTGPAIITTERPLELSHSISIYNRFCVSLEQI
jgi:hypothetical protein